jgi:FXSXX-COOH protein
MVPTEELRPAYVSTMADLRDIPLAEMPALGLDVLGRTIGRVLPAPSANPVPVAAFQSSI